MKKMIATSILLVAALSVSACSGDPEAPEAETVTETRMDEVDVIDGTISDDMVDVDAQPTGEEPAEGSDESNATSGNDSEEESEE